MQFSFVDLFLKKINFRKTIIGKSFFLLLLFIFKWINETIRIEIMPSIKRI